MRIAEVIPIDDYILFVETEEGTTGIFDLKPYLDGEVFSLLQDRTEFSEVHNGGYFIEWPCGADLSADTIEAHLKTTPPDIAQQLHKADQKAVRRTPHTLRS
jgi:hypothetical protein